MKRIFAILLAFSLVLGIGPVFAASFDAHHATAFMDIKFECGCTSYGTGAMIGRYGLVTAGHNLYCPDHGKPLKTCSFLFGAKSPNSGKYRYNGSFQFWSYDTFSYGYSSSNDIGYVIFSKPVGDSTGWYGYWVGSDYDMNMEFTNVYNYSDRARLQTLYTIQYVEDSNRISMDEYLGYSEGGPVFFSNEDIEWPTVVAVYTSHTTSGRGVGRRLTNQIINDMRADGAFN